MEQPARKRTRYLCPTVIPNTENGKETWREIIDVDKNDKFNYQKSPLISEIFFDISLCFDHFKNKNSSIEKNVELIHEILENSYVTDDIVMWHEESLSCDKLLSIYKKKIYKNNQKAAKAAKIILALCFHKIVILCIKHYGTGILPTDFVCSFIDQTSKQSKFSLKVPMTYLKQVIHNTENLAASLNQIMDIRRKFERNVFEIIVYKVRKEEQNSILMNRNTLFNCFDLFTYISSFI